MSRHSQDCRCRKQFWSKLSVDVLARSRRLDSTSCFRWPTRAALTCLKTSFYFLFVGWLSACGSIPPMHAEGRYITTQHGTARFRDALKGAQEYCAGFGMGVRHLGTDSPGLSISRFECIEASK